MLLLGSVSTAKVQQNADIGYDITMSIVVDYFRYDMSIAMRRSVFRPHQRSPDVSGNRTLRQPELLRSYCLQHQLNSEE